MIKKAIKDIKSFAIYVAIGFIISLSITLLMKSLIYIGLNYNIASTLSALSVFVIPISAGCWIVKELKKIVTIPNTTFR